MTKSWGKKAWTFNSLEIYKSKENIHVLYNLVMYGFQDYVKD